MLATNAGLAHKLAVLEKKYDAKFKVVSGTPPMPYMDVVMPREAGCRKRPGD